MEVLFHVPLWNRSRRQIRQQTTLDTRVPSRTLVLLSCHISILRYYQNIYRCITFHCVGSHPSPHQTTGMRVPCLQISSRQSPQTIEFSLLSAVWCISLVVYLCHSIFSTAPAMMAAPILTFSLALVFFMPWSVSPEGKTSVHGMEQRLIFLVFTAQLLEENFYIGLNEYTSSACPG